MGSDSCVCGGAATRFSKVFVGTSPNGLGVLGRLFQAACWHCRSQAVAAQVSGIAVCLSTFRQGRRCSALVCNLPEQLAVLFVNVV